MKGKYFMNHSFSVDGFLQWGEGFLFLLHTFFSFGVMDAHSLDIRAALKIGFIFGFVFLLLFAFLKLVTWEGNCFFLDHWIRYMIFTSLGNITCESRPVTPNYDLFRRGQGVKSQLKTTLICQSSNVGLKTQISLGKLPFFFFFA